MKNTWLFISNRPITAAIKCNGIREDIILNGTGIIQISQECLIQTKKNTLISESFHSIPVQAAFIKPIEFNLTTVPQATHFQSTQLETEPVLASSDDFTDLMIQQRSIQKIFKSKTWHTIGHHVATGTSTLVVMVLLFIAYKVKICRRKNTPFTLKFLSKHIPEREPEPTEECISQQQVTQPPTTGRMNYNLEEILRRNATPTYAVPAKCSRNEHA